MTPSRKQWWSVFSWSLAASLGVAGMWGAHNKAKNDAALEIVAIESKRQLAVTQIKLAEERAKRIEAELASRDAEDEALNALRESADHGYMGLDHEGRVTKWNPALEKWTGYTAGEMLGQTLEKVMEPEDYANHAAGYPAWIVNSEQPINTLKLECKFVRKDGKRTKVGVTARKVPGLHPGQPPYAIGLVDRPRQVLDLTEAKP